MDFTAAIANTISAPITLVDNGVIRSNVAFGQTLSGVISGTGKTLTFNNDTAGTANGSSGAVNVTGGTLTLATVDASTDAISFGGGEGGYGAFTISDGTFTQQRFMFGGTGSTTALGGVGVGLITGGTVNSTGWLILSRAGASTGILTVNGGLLNHSGASNDLAVGLAGSGRAELNMGGGLLDNTGGRVTFSGGTGGSFHWSGTGLVNLNGGTLLTNSITYDTAVSPFSPNANSYVNFGGGTLKAASSSASFFPAHTPAGTGVSQVYVNGAFGSFTGGAIIDTNGFDPTTSANFLAPTGNGVTGLMIDNAGSGYVGAPAVKILDGGLPSTATAYAIVGTDPAIPATFGKVTSVVITNPGVIVGTPTVSLVGGGGTGAAVSVASTGPNTSGGLTKTGSGQLTLTGNSTYTGLTSVSAGTLVVAGAATLTATSGLSVSSGAGFSFLPTVPATALTLGAGSTLSLANNSTISTTFESSIAVAGAATNSGSVNIALSGAFTSGNTYTVLTAAGGLDSSTYKVLNPSSFTYTTNATPTAVTITPITATPLAAAYWIGGFSGLPGVWSASDGSGAGNWTTDGLGTASPLVPGPTANVFFPDASATGTVNQTGGAISFTAGNQVLVGQNTVGNQGVYNMSGGSITTFASATRGVMLGVNTNPAPGPASGGGTFNLSGTAVLNMISGGNSILQIGRSDVVANNTTNVFNQTGGAASVGILAMGGAAASGSTGVSSTLTLDGGTLRPSAASATYLSGLTNAFIQAGGANFDVPTGRNITVSQSLLTDLVSLGGGLSKSGVGVLTLSGANTYTGTTTVSAGGLVARNLASLPGIATLHQISLSGSSTLTLGVGGVGEFASTDVDTVLTNADFNTGTALGFDTANAAGGFTYATNISNASGVAGTNLGVAKSGANTLVLSGANTYSGPTTITGGILEIGVSNNLGDASPTNSIILAGGTLSSGANAFTLDNTRPVSITASSGFRAEILGTLTITTDLANGANSIALTGAGSIIVNGVIGTGVTPTGGLTIGSSTQPANVTLNGNNLFTGNVTLPASNIQPFAVLTVTNSGALGVGPKNVQAAGGGEIHLQNNITLAANISFTTSGSAQQNGVAGVNRPVIANDSGNNTIEGNISMTSGNGATIISSDSGLLTLNGSLTATAATRQLQVRGNGAGVINGVISNGLTVNMPVLKDGGSGTWTFNGANTYSGATTVSAGTLALGNAAALGTGAAAVNSGGSLDLGGQTVANAVTVNAAGTLTGSGAAGAATLAGTITPGGSGNGLITVASATVAATSNLALQLGGTGARGTAYDTVTVNSALALDGTITVTLNGLVPAATQTFDLIDSTGAINVAGFDVNTDLVLPPLDPGLAWDTSTFATDGQITVVVDLDPFTAWATANSVEGGKGGDEDGDGTTNLVEFATNADPQSGSSGARVYGLVHPIGGSPVLTYTVATRAAAIFAPNGSRQEATKDLVKYSIEGTNDLSIWNSVVVTEVTGGDATAVRAAIVPALPTLDSGWEWHTFRTDDNTAVDPSDFIRLNVTEAP